MRKAMPAVVAYEVKTMLSPVSQTFGKEHRFVMPKSRKLLMLIIFTEAPAATAYRIPSEFDRKKFDIS